MASTIHRNISSGTSSTIDDHLPSIQIVHSERRSAASEYEPAHHYRAGALMRGASSPPRLTRYAWLSIATAFTTLALKFLASRVTGSVGLLSDALESLVNVGAALMLFAMLRIAAQPPDEDHAYGHGKAEYFASGFEGVLVIIAAAGITYAATLRLFHPQPLEHTGVGLTLTII